MSSAGSRVRGEKVIIGWDSETVNEVAGVAPSCGCGFMYQMGSSRDQLGRGRRGWFCRLVVVMGNTTGT